MLPLQLLATYSPHGLVFLHFRKVVLQYKLWDQIRTDIGKEWKLFLFVNDSLSHLRNDCSKPPHLQSTSRQVQQPRIIFQYSIKFLMIVYRITWLNMYG